MIPPAHWDSHLERTETNILKAKVGWNKDLSEDRTEAGKFSSNISICGLLFLHVSGEEVPAAAGGKPAGPEAEVGGCWGEKLLGLPRAGVPGVSAGDGPAHKDLAVQVSVSYWF